MDRDRRADVIGPALTVRSVFSGPGAAELWLLKSGIWAKQTIGRQLANSGRRKPGTASDRRVGPAGLSDAWGSGHPRVRPHRG